MRLLLRGEHVFQCATSPPEAREHPAAHAPQRERGGAEPPVRRHERRQRDEPPAQMQPPRAARREPRRGAAGRRRVCAARDRLARGRRDGRATDSTELASPRLISILKSYTVPTALV